ncbi:ATP-grasp fold amidoligase family protein [Cetobacterium sp.]|uniref:ATP-grasp fold amidoligase family protein n=1 Tax=Cetobacterium sp. TaxID=2071632 RepID=UPI003F673C43
MDNPITYNEKLQWLKLNDKKDEYTNLVDKIEVRNYIKKLIGEEYLVPLIGIYNKANDIDFNNLPKKFVIKCNHDSGNIWICKNKKNFDIEKTKKEINKALKKNYYYQGYEYPYKNITPKILIEEYLEDNETKDLYDYKFFCFSGKVKTLFIASNRQKDVRFDFFDTNFNKLEVMQYYKNSKKYIKKPKNFEKMIELSEILSQKIKHVRVDFYEVNGKILFGELTFYHFGGFKKFTPEDFDIFMGKFLDIEEIQNE